MRAVRTTILLAGLAIAVVWLFLRERPRPQVVSPSPEPTHEPELEPEPELPPILVDPQIIIKKGDRTLTVLSAGGAVRTYAVALGFSPIGDKEREGDGRTPEGEFFVCTKNPDSRHVRALGISYPSEPHATEALDLGHINKRQFRHIIDALHHYDRPPWNTPLGGEIMIHGGGTDDDWTHGCIAMADEHASELYDAIPLGTPIEIIP